MLYNLNMTQPSRWRPRRRAGGCFNSKLTGLPSQQLEVVTYNTANHSYKRTMLTQSRNSFENEIFNVMRSETFVTFQACHCRPRRRCPWSSAAASPSPSSGVSEARRRLRATSALAWPSLRVCASTLRRARRRRRRGPTAKKLGIEFHCTSFVN
jgi:hypothetical protein